MPHGPHRPLPHQLGGLSSPPAKYRNLLPRPKHFMIFMIVSSGWWYTYPSEKYEFVSWDDDISNIWKVIKAMFQTTNQS